MSRVSRKTLNDINVGQGLVPTEALRTALDAGSAKDTELVEAVFIACKEGKYLMQDTLVDWINAASPSSTSVFNMMWPALRRDQWAVLKLLGFKPAGGLTEEAALEILTHVGVKTGEPIRAELMRALAKLGSPRCLPWLEELRQDYESLANQKNSVLLAAPNALTNAEAMAMRESLDLCRTAIASILTRESITSIAEATRVGPGYRAGH